MTFNHWQKDMWILPEGIHREHTEACMSHKTSFNFSREKSHKQYKLSTQTCPITFKTSETWQSFFLFYFFYLYFHWKWKNTHCTSKSTESFVEHKDVHKTKILFWHYKTVKDLHIYNFGPSIFCLQTTCWQTDSVFKGTPPSISIVYFFFFCGYDRIILEDHCEL